MYRWRCFGGEYTALLRRHGKSPSSPSSPHGLRGASAHLALVAVVAYGVICHGSDGRRSSLGIQGGHDLGGVRVAGKYLACAFPWSKCGLVRAPFREIQLACILDMSSADGGVRCALLSLLDPYSATVRHTRGGLLSVVDRFEYRPTAHYAPFVGANFTSRP